MFMTLWKRRLTNTSRWLFLSAQAEREPLALSLTLPTKVSCVFTARVPPRWLSNTALLRLLSTDLYRILMMMRKLRLSAKSASRLLLENATEPYSSPTKMSILTHGVKSNRKSMTEKRKKSLRANLLWLVSSDSWTLSDQELEKLSSSATSPALTCACAQAITLTPPLPSPSRPV